MKPSISGGKLFLKNHLPDLAVHLSSLNETLLLREKNWLHFLPGHRGNPLTCAVFHFHCEPIIRELDVELLPSHVWHSVENTHTYTSAVYTWLHVVRSQMKYLVECCVAFLMPTKRS